MGIRLFQGFPVDIDLALLYLHLIPGQAYNPLYPDLLRAVGSTQDHYLAPMGRVEEIMPPQAPVDCLVYQQTLALFEGGVHAVFLDLKALDRCLNQKKNDEGEEEGLQDIAQEPHSFVYYNLTIFYVPSL